MALKNNSKIRWMIVRKYIYTTEADSRREFIDLPDIWQKKKRIKKFDHLSPNFMMDKVLELMNTCGEKMYGGPLRLQILLPNRSIPVILSTQSSNFFPYYTGY